MKRWSPERPPSPGQLLAVLLIAADLGFLLLHTLSIQRTRWARPELLLTEDGTIPEHYQYVKLAWVAILLLLLAIVHLRRRYLPWAALFGYVVLDDYFAIHESVGSRIDVATPNTAVLGIPVQALGELVLPGLATALLAPFLLWSIVRPPAPDRAVLRRVALLVAIFAVFGAGVDLLHAAAPESGEGWKVWGVIEEGGELVVASLLVAYLFTSLVRLREFAPASKSTRDGGAHPIASSANRPSPPS